MALLKDLTASTNITEYINLEIDQDIVKVENTALDGTYYVQIIGDPVELYMITAYVDRDGKTALQTAEKSGNILQADVKHGTYYGRIKTVKFGNRMAGDYFMASIVLAKVAIA